ncbi:MAG: site-specific DNA-methyltransferase [Phycisphaerae bacterium]|nr:site-specific DNA-methyltransferase [Phycisphaerae bacterium]
MNVALGQVNHGDCIEGMAAMEAGSVDLVFADPPFNIGYDYDAYDDKQEHEVYIDWSRRWMRAVHRVLKPSGTFWLAIGDEYAAELKLIAQGAFPGVPLLDEDPARSAPTETPPPTRRRGRRRRSQIEPSARGFHCRSWVIWYYTFGVHCTQKFTRSHAHLFHFVKDPKDFTFNADDVRVPSARQLVYADKRANPKGRMPDDTWITPPGGPSGGYDHEPGSKAPTDSSEIRRRPTRPGPPTHDGFILRPQDLPEGFTPDSDTWYFSRVAGTFKEREGWHGCQMPEQLLGRIIRACSNKGDLVLDPFVGSGTTLVVAKKLGRQCMGFELSQEYADQARKRLAAAATGDRLTGFEEPLVSAPGTLSRSVRHDSDAQATFDLEAESSDTAKPQPRARRAEAKTGTSTNRMASA